MSKLYVTITNLEFDMPPDEAEAIVMELMGLFQVHVGDKTQAVATDHPHNMILEDLNKYDGPILEKEVRDQ